MTDQRRKRPRDPAQLAKFVVDIATGEMTTPHQSPLPPQSTAELVDLRGQSR